MAKIVWNADHYGVEIQTKTEHFVVSYHPSYTMNWHEAKRLTNNTRVRGWDIPTKEQMSAIAYYLPVINDLMEQNGGFRIFRPHWAEEKDDSYAWYINVGNGDVNYANKYTVVNVRLVKTL